MAAIPHLETLRVYRMITDDAVAGLSSARSLKALLLAGDFQDTRQLITDASLADLSKIKSLESLGLYYGKFTDKGMEYLSGLPRLKSLQIPNNRVRETERGITDAGLEHLSKLAHLEELDLRGQFSDEALKRLKDRRPGLRFGRWIQEARPLFERQDTSASSSSGPGPARKEERANATTGDDAPGPAPVAEREGASHPDSRTNTIVPGVGVGDYKFGMSKDEVLKRIKGRTSRQKGDLMEVDGLVINIVNDSVKGITVLSRLYRFASGLGVGDSEQKIKQSFGDDFLLEETEWKDFLTYEKEGLQFEIHKKNRTVMEINVTQKNVRGHGNSSAKPIESVNEFDSVGGKDLSKLDLSARKGLIATLGFDQRTVWPERSKMPPGIDPERILTDAMNPGLGVHELHQQGITGRGVNVAVIDQPLYMDHPEYAGKIVEYYDAGCGSSKNSMHGPAMASQLVGNRCGTAPGARVYYAAAPSWKMDAAFYADALDWIIAQNKQLPASEKIRVVSVSAQPSGAGSRYSNQRLWDQAVQRAEANGILVLDCTWQHGFVSVCWLDPQDRESVESCTPGFRRDPVKVDEGHIHVPTAPRTTGQCYGERSFGYAYDSGGSRSGREMSKGGYSDAIPYAAGILALGWQVRPELPPQQMGELLFESAFTHEKGAKIIDPGNFIRMVRITKAAPIQSVQQRNTRSYSENRTIVPGVGVGNYRFGMSKDELLERIAGRTARQEGDLVFVDGLVINIVNDSVKGITVLRPQYKFANGLGVGDPEERIKRAFGSDFQLKETEWKDFLTYEKQGLEFEIHKKNRTVMEINVYQMGKQRELESLPEYDPDSDNPFQPDLRTRDLSKLDLGNSIDDLMYATFNDKTIWPASHRLPFEFNWQRIMELGKNPGLGVRSLHQEGITGRGVGIAILDQPLLVDHQEYADRLRLYEEIHIQKGTDPQMHGPAVASIALGKTVGVAPEADLYYIARWSFDWETGEETLRYNVQAIHRIIEINEQLPEDKKIRVISISKGWTPSHKEYKEIAEAVEKAKAQGMLVVCTSVELNHDGCDFAGLGRPPLADPDLFESYEPGLFLAKLFDAGRQPRWQR
jgi:subtilisin family serine protease